MSALWAGVDLGTQSVKVLVVDDTGAVFAEAASPLTSVRSGDRHEQDPALWASATRSAMAAAMATLSVADRARIGAVAVCSTSGTVTVLDEAGVPTTPGIMYDDRRAGAQAERVAAADPDLWDRLGYRIQPTWAVCTIADLAARGELRTGVRVVHQGDFIGELMCGHPVATDWSTALKSGYDVAALTWPSEVHARLGIPTAALPDVVAPGTRIGTTSATWAAATGLPEGTALIAGMTDGCAAQLGAGALGGGDWHSVLGTTLVLKGVTATPLHDASGALYSHRAPHGNFWLPGGASSVGAGVISSVLPDADLVALGERAERERGPIPVTYPLHGTGERFPFLRGYAAGFVLRDGQALGLERLRDADDAVTLRTLFAGVACVERLSFDLLESLGAGLDGTISSSGGGTRSALWTRMRATLLGRPLALPASAEASLGMAILAAWGADPRLDLPDRARELSRIARTVEPDPTLHAELEDGYGRFRDELHRRGWISQW